MSSLSEGEERERAGKMLKAACSGGRVEIVRVLLDKWLAEEVVVEEVVVVVEEEEGETKGEERREEERGGERRRREREEWVCRLVDEKLVVRSAALGGHLEVVKMLLERVQGVDVNATSETVNGSTALYMACQNGHGEVVRLLLATSGIDVNQARTTYGDTPLFMACQFGHAPVVKLLLTVSGIDINKGAPGWSPLHLAQHFKFTEIVQLLVDAGAQ